MGKVNCFDWKKYEIEKRKIYNRNIAPDDYEKAIIELEKKLSNPDCNLN